MEIPIDVLIVNEALIRLEIKKRDEGCFTIRGCIIPSANKHGIIRHSFSPLVYFFIHTTRIKINSNQSII